MKRRTAALVAATLAAIATADVLAARFGPKVSVLNAFWLIGLVIVTRDALHDNWEGRGLVWRMGALIAAGGGRSHTGRASGSPRRPDP